MLPFLGKLVGDSQWLFVWTLECRRDIAPLCDRAVEGRIAAMENQGASPDPLSDENALLREALAFIGDLGSDTDDLSPLDTRTGDLWSPLSAPLESGAVQAVPTSALEHDAPPSLVLPASGASKPKANRSRDKRREELLYLREMVRELESKLAQIKRQGNQQKLLEAPGEEARSSVLVRAAWEQVAMSQAVERERAEMENIGLKRLLEEQIQVGKALERLLRKGPKLGVTLPLLYLCSWRGGVESVLTLLIFSLHDRILDKCHVGIPKSECGLILCPRRGMIPISLRSWWRRARANTLRHRACSPRCCSSWRVN
jgi:hypothetical protein